MSGVIRPNSFCKITLGRPEWCQTLKRHRDFEGATQRFAKNHTDVPPAKQAVGNAIGWTYAFNVAGLDNLIKAISTIDSNFLEGLRHRGSLSKTVAAILTYPVSI